MGWSPPVGGLVRGGAVGRRQRDRRDGAAAFGVRRASTEPRQRAASSRAIGNPRPVPRRREARPTVPRWKRLNTVSSSPGDRPGPSSVTDSRPGAGDDRDRLPGRAVVDRVLQDGVQDPVEVRGGAAHQGRRRRAARSSPPGSARPPGPAPASRSVTASGARAAPASLSTSSSVTTSESRSTSSSAPSICSREPVAAASSSRSRSPVSGVRSWWDASATKSRCASTIRCTRAVISLNACPTSRCSRDPSISTRADRSPSPARRAATASRRSGRDDARRQERARAQAQREHDHAHEHQPDRRRATPPGPRRRRSG